jgi:hypothetical protein
VVDALAAAALWSNAGTLQILAEMERRLAAAGGRR